jgi:hypothetical protein
MGRNKLTQLLKSEDKGISKTFGPNGVLSRLFRQMLFDMGINGNKFGSLLEDYVRDSKYCVPETKKDQTSTRGNLTKEFIKPQMTWKVFCKACKFLQIVKMDVRVVVTFANGYKSEHSSPVNFGGRKNLEEWTKELNQPEEQELVQYVQCLQPFGDSTKAE